MVNTHGFLNSTAFKKLACPSLFGMISPYHTIARELVQAAVGPAIPGCPILSPGLQLWFCNHTPYAIQQICLTELCFLFYRPYFWLLYSTAYLQIESWCIHEDVADSSYRLGYGGRFHTLNISAVSMSHWSGYLLNSRGRGVCSGWRSLPAGE